MIHIEGMGWMGSILGMHLDERGIPFTWHDIEAPILAWRASTGLCYPCGEGNTLRDQDARSMPDLRVWHGWAKGRGPVFPPGTVHMIDFTYSCVKPPHNGPQPRVVGNGWKISSVPAVRVDVPVVVEAARFRFADRRLDDAPRRKTGDVLVRAHGFTSRLDQVVWGWNRPVKLGLPQELTRELNFDRTSIYTRFKWAMAYAYPVVTQPGWYLAGSTLLGQRIPHRLTDEQVATQWELWRRRLTRMAPWVTIEGWGDPVQGWRPRGKNTDSGFPYRRGDVITFPPLWHSGVRWAPSTIAKALELL